MRIALVEPYYGGSHKAWADGYAQSSRNEVVLVTHEARFWKWRMHGGFLTLSDQLARMIESGGRPDVILASSMMDVASFAGAVRHIAPGVPIAVYFHESQFTYPLSPADKTDLTYPLKNWSSAAVADLVMFNSDYHRDVFREEARRLLNGFPEYKHVGRVDKVIDASVVLPVGIDLERLVTVERIGSDPPLILWNHRWEHDKGPEELHAIVRTLIDMGVKFQLAMCGEVFVSVPEAFSDVVETVGDRLVHKGWAERPRYEELLTSASVALSTAHQEFFGIGVVEAIAGGAHPVLPNRLVYPERVRDVGLDPTEVLYESSREAAALVATAMDRPSTADTRAATLRYDWQAVARMYDSALASM